MGVQFASRVLLIKGEQIAAALLEWEGEPE
jgi:hypothetical protein